MVVTPEGELVLEMKVPTTREDLRRVIGGIEGPKRVVFEEGPLSGLVRDALEGVCDEIVSCDSSRNALISRSEDSDDERDAWRLATLSRAGALHPVYVPQGSHRTLRSLLNHDRGLSQLMSSTKSRIKALCRRYEVSYHGVGVYRREGREKVLGELSDPAIRWQMESCYRLLLFLEKERRGAHRTIKGASRSFEEVKYLKTIPGVGPVTSHTLVAWIVDPERFKSRSAVSSYGGLGLTHHVTNWKTVGRPRASKRGQRAVKRVLFIAARAAIQGKNALAQRYQARLKSGWDDRKAIRDIARKILFIGCVLCKRKEAYRDELVGVPTPTR
jgi:transposase